MASEWPEVRLGDVSKVITKGTTPTTVGYCFTSSGINFVKSESVTFDGSIDRSKFAFVDLETHEALKRSQLREGDILFSMAGVFIGKSAVVPKGILPANTNQAVGIVRLDQDRALPRFIDYHLRNPSYNRFLNNSVAQSAQPNLNLAEIGNLPIKLPPLPEQRAIAHILGTLDDKIELNRRMNETLEAMARAFFKAWFVDFDPVRAKMEGRDPGLPKPIADLFPARLVDSELGEIPEGWEVRKLGDLLELAYGKALKAEDRRNGDVPVYGSNGQVGWHDERLAAGPGIVVGRKGNPGVATWAPTDFFVIDTAFHVVPKAVCRGAHFLFHVLQTHDLASLGADSAVPGLNRNLAYMSMQVLPPRRLLDEFDSYVSSLAARLHHCSTESRTLTTLRDTVLPKLISGELRVKHAEQLIEEAG